MLIEDILKNTAATTKKKIRQLVVRELEEDPKQNFIAYVDDQQNSFDVNIRLAGSRIVSHTCDCGSNDDFCIHQLAVLDTLITNRKEPVDIPKIQRKKKRSPIEELVHTADPHTLRDWLLQYFKKNKDAAVEFSMVFGQRQKECTADDVEKTINEIAKTVLQRKRLGIPAPTVKKLVDLLQIALQPIEEYITYNLTKPIASELFSAICIGLDQLQFKIQTNSTRLNVFVQDMIQRQVDRIGQLQSIEDWKAAFLPSWRRYLDFALPLSDPEFRSIEGTYNAASLERQHILAEVVREEVIAHDYRSSDLKWQFSHVLLTILVNNGLFDALADRFTPHYQGFEYNYLLVQAVLKSDPPLGEKYIDQITQNMTWGNDQGAFFDLLEKAYELQNNVPKLLDIRKKSFFSRPSLQKYKFVLEHERDENERLRFKAIVRKELTRAYTQSHQMVLFAIHAYEKNWKYLTNTLSVQFTPLVLFWPYVEQMYAVDKMKVLHTLYHIGDREAVDMPTNDPKVHDAIISFIKSHYTAEEFNRVFRYVPDNTFNKEVAKQFRR